MQYNTILDTNVTLYVHCIMRDKIILINYSSYTSTLFFAIKTSGLRITLSLRIMTMQYEEAVETWRPSVGTIAAMNRRVRTVGRQLRCYRLIRARPCENKALRRHTPLTSSRRRRYSRPS